ncbi:MAG: hypothetical protein H6711_25015 [Myxococcales bacterium]|nr:hypothetical protein [Myxococcales bacterium]
MTREHDESNDDRGALVLPPEPAKRGTFALLVPGNVCWTVSDFAGGYRLDFRPMTPAEHLQRERERGER